MAGRNLHKRPIILGVFLLTLGLIAGGRRRADAEHIFPPPQLQPDIVSTYVLVDYEALSGVFTASGYAKTVDYDGVAPYDYRIDGGTFDISMALDQDTGEQIGGTVAIGGTITEVGATSGSLLTGPITAFGFPDPPGGKIFQFLFHVTGGDLADDFSPTGAIVLNTVASGFAGDFHSDFSNAQTMYGITYGVGTADTFLTPQPSSLTAMSFLGPAGVLYGLWAWRRRRRKAA